MRRMAASGQTFIISSFERHPLCQINILEYGNIPYPCHVEWKAIHRAECPGDAHHVVDNIVVCLCLWEGDGGGVH